VPGVTRDDLVKEISQVAYGQPPSPDRSIQLDTLTRIVREAVRATGFLNAILYEQRDGAFATIVSATGDFVADLVPVQSAALPAEPIAVAIQHVGPQPTTSILFGGAAANAVRSAAIVPVSRDTPTYLVLVDARHRPRLSAAQIYTLRAHAAHIATVFELASAQELAGSMDSTDLERLRLLESVAVHARDSIIITEAEPIDLPGPRILYCNAAFTHATGYSVEEVIGKTPRLLQGPGTDPATRAKLRRALSAWEPVEVELVNYRKDGTMFWVELSIVPVANEQGWFTHWVSVQRDISERKSAEDLAIRVLVAEGQNAALESEIVERKRVEAELLYTAFHDGLTRLRNRAFFMEKLQAVLDRENGAAGCAILFLDLDRFKVVNDSLGHAQGDALLRDIAQRLRRCVRPQDTLARIGGDEFAILVEDDAGLSTAVQIAERILEAMGTPLQLARQSVFPSCSIGIAQPLGRKTSPDDLIRDADIAMYESKRAGYGDYAIFDTSMHDSAVARLTLQTDLRLAVERGDFHLAYQPVLDPTTGHVSSFEALVRWDHPTRGRIAPSEFIPVAEEIGLIREIDRRVMREACSQLKNWHIQSGRSTLRMSVNTSAAEFVDPAFLEDLAGVLSGYDLPPECLELEITEGIFLHPSPEVANIIAEVRLSGVRIALDDFGTGYSSLSYINRYPIDTIKIDKSFIDEICSRQATRAIVELIVGLGRALDLNIIAEGVETQDQVDQLVTIGCKAIQGFLYAEPLTAAEATRMIQATAERREPMGTLPAP